MYECEKNKPTCNFFTRKDVDNLSKDNISEKTQARKNIKQGIDVLSNWFDELNKKLYEYIKLKKINLN